MANTTNTRIAPSTWTLVTTGTNGTLSNSSKWDMQVVESDTAPAAGLYGAYLEPKKSVGFTLNPTQSIYVKSAYAGTFALTLE